jgi:hypothetical protein
MSRLRDVDANIPFYTIVAEEYKPLLLSSNNERKDDINNRISLSVSITYKDYRSDIMNRDFSFLKEGMLVIEDMDIGQLYRNVVKADNDSILKKVTSELLFLFHCVMDDKDRAEVEIKFKKPKKQKKPKSDIALDMNSLLSKNSKDLKKLESGQADMGEVMEKVLQNNGKDFAKIATSLLGGMGLDMGAMNKKKKGKSASTAE